MFDGLNYLIESRHLPPQKKRRHAYVLSTEKRLWRNAFYRVVLEYQNSLFHFCSLISSDVGDLPRGGFPRKSEKRRVAPPTYPTLNAEQKTKPPETDAINETTATKTNPNEPKTKNIPRGVSPCFFERAAGRPTAVPLVLRFLVAFGVGFPMRWFR